MLRTHARRLRPHLGGGRIALLFGLFLLLSQQVFAADREFARRFYINTEGDMVYVGNTLTSCVTGAANCAAARAGGAYNNNSFTPMAYVDVDSDATTFDSSSANLSMPAGSTVKFAGLYWGGDIAAGPPRNQALFKVPGAFGYTLLTADTFDASSTTPVYQSFKDVTAMVAAAGNGTYTVANVQTDVGNDDQAGWTLVVVYSNLSLPLRNFALYDGMKYASNQTILIPVSGFLTPLSGPIVTRLGTVVYDGDYNTTGDTISLNNVLISDPTNPVNNSYNSTISDLGVRVTSKNPDYVNQLGFDIDRWAVPDGIIGNGTTSAEVRVTSPSAGEVMWVGVINFATDIYVPIIVPNVVKTAIDLNGGYLLPGDVLRWNVVMTNTGLDSGVGLIATDNIPAYLTYQPNSLNVTAGANTGTKSDASGDDQAEYISSGTPRVVFRLGTGANSTTGGVLPYLDSTTFQFDTIVNSGVPAGTILSNEVQIQYSGQTIGDTFAASSAAATATVMGPPTIVKSFVPSVIDVNAASVLTIVVSNPAGNPGPATGVTFTDTYPAGLVNAATPNPQINCTPGSTAGTLTGGVAAGNTIGMSPGATIAVNGSCTITVNVTSSTIGNYTNTTSVVTSTNGGSSVAGGSSTLSVGKPAITKAFSPTSITFGGTSTITFVITNLAASGLTGMNFSDTLTNMQVAATPAVTNTCGGTVTATAGSGSISLAGGTIGATTSCAITVNVTSSTMGVHPNTTTGVASTQSGAAGNPSNTASLTVIAPPNASKSFFPPSVQLNVPSTLTITISNPNTATTITGMSFTDTYPANTRNDTPANTTLNCTPGSTATLVGGANGGTTLGMSGGSLLPGGSCTVTAQVEGITSTGNRNNSTGAITTGNAGSGTAATATLNITNLTAPTLTKAIAAASIPTGGTTTLTITLNNSNGTAVTGVAFTDFFPPDMLIHSTPGLSNTCGGTATGAAGTGVLSLTGGTIPATGSCAVAVTITSSTTGNYTNSTGTVVTANGGTFGPATDTLDVLAPPVITKTFVPDAIATGGDVNGAPFTDLIITLSNPTTATTALTGVGVVDNFPANVVGHRTNVSSNTCGGTYTDQGGGGIGRNDTGIILSGVTLNPNASCQISVRLRSGTAGTYTNTTNAVTSGNGGTGGTASAVLTVGRPDITKAFCASPIAPGASCLLTITLSNPTATDMTLAAFTDTYPTGMTNTATPSGATTCALGTVTAAANGPSVSLSGATIPAAGSCTVTVNVMTTQTGTNTIPAGGLTTNVGTNGTPASATLYAYIPPTVTKSFSVGSMLIGGTATMTITLTNVNGISATTVNLTDTFPTNMVVAATPNMTSTCGTVEGRTGAGAWGAPASGNTAVRLNAGTVANSSFCTITIDVTSSTAGVYNNSTGSVTTANVGTGTAANATLVVMGPPTVSKSFSPASVLTNEVSLLTITLTNTNTVAITGAAFTDTYPAGLVNDATPSPTTSCTGGTAAATAGGNTLTLSGGTIPASGSCTVTVRVKSASAGSYNNSTGTVTTTNAGNGTSASATLTVSVPMPNLQVLKLQSVVSDPINGGTFPKSIPGALISYTIRVTNTGPGTIDNNTVFISDPIPANTSMFVNDLGGVGNGPVIFTNGSPTSGLGWTFTSLSNDTDSIDFSADGVDWTTLDPVPDGDGFAPAVRYIRLKPTGSMNAAGGGNPYFDVTFRVRVD